MLLWADAAAAQVATPAPSTGATVDEGRAHDPSGAQSGAADDEAEAKRAFEDGLGLLRAGQWVDAETSFRRSLALSPRPSASYDLAFVLYTQGRARESAEILRRLLTAPASTPDTRYREYAGVLLAEVVAQHLSTLRIVVDPPTADIRIDGAITTPGGAARTMQLDLGTHELQVSAPGFVAQRLHLIAEPRAEIERRIALAPLRLGAGDGAAARQRASAPREGQLPLLRLVPWAAVGLGGAILAGAAVTGVLAKEADDAFGRACPSFQHCDPSLVSTRDKAVVLGHVTDALLVSGGALVAGGITWRVLFHPGPPAGLTAQAPLVTASGVY
jgi:hypothetical protein